MYISYYKNIALHFKVTLLVFIKGEPFLPSIVYNIIFYAGFICTLLEFDFGVM